MVLNCQKCGNPVEVSLEHSSQCEVCALPVGLVPFYFPPSEYVHFASGILVSFANWINEDLAAVGAIRGESEQ